jgi:FixJ family two-component response regulator
MGRGAMVVIAGPDVSGDETECSNFDSINRSYMNAAAILVSVVDDDDSVRESLPDLLKEFGFASEVFATPNDFLQSAFVGKSTCLILDIAMPGMSGPELWRELLRRGHNIPTIFITARADLASQIDTQEGVIGCLLKPFSESVLLEALNRALNLK